MSPTQIEQLINHHFSLLFDPKDTVILGHRAFNYPWLRCAITDKGRALLIETNSGFSPFASQQRSAGRIYYGKIRVEETRWIIEGKERRFIAIYCQKKHLIYLFSRLTADIVWHLLNEGPQSGDPWNYITQRLQGWRMLFSSTDSKSEEKGLLGELYVLYYLMTNWNVPVTAWTGPLGGVKDIRLANQNLEVKTTSVRYGYSVEITGLYQTAVLTKQEMMVFVRVEETPNGSLSLASLKREISKLCDLSGHSAELTMRLSEYSDDLFNSPAQWEVLEAVVFNIDEHFPHISNESFVHQRLPDNILRISWTADLTSLPKMNLSEIDF